MGPAPQFLSEIMGDGADVSPFAAGNLDVYVGIFIGNKDCWSEGYGTEALRLMIRYGFDQLNLHKISLRVFCFNTRAIRAYEKVGFRREAIFRDHGYRNGEYCDDYAMSILEDEWREKNGKSVYSRG